MQNKKPIIGITPSRNDNMIMLRTHYTTALTEMGAVPVILPLKTDRDAINALCETLDGLLFSGGIDIHPKYYGEEIETETVEFDEQRDAFEFALFEQFVTTGKPILGICRGMQFLNVALGGTLFQDIPNHRQTGERWDTPYRVNVLKATHLFDVVGEETFSVNSFHHQAVKFLAPSLRPTAFSVDDNIIEAFETTGTQYLTGVQWHPEDFYRTSKPQQLIFKSFIDSCKR